MSDSLRMLTYNVQCRSWAMEVGADQAIPPSETVVPRAKLISKNILNSRHDYDVVCLNEVFDEDGRDVFKSELLGRYPYAITKANFGNVEVAWPGKPHIPINTSALYWSLSGVGLAASLALLGTPKLEDSGLMLFSRWPFALRPLDEQLLNLLSPLAASELTPLGFPEIGFLAYADSTDNDAWAAKGMIYARIQRPAGRTYHVFASHTQADSKVISENQDERRLQFAAVAQFVQSAVGRPPVDEAVFMMGDFNIPGGQEALAVTPQTQEWDARFSTHGGLLTDDLVDVHGREQCTGVGTPPFDRGLRDPGYTAAVNYAPPEQRLDYVFRNRGCDLVGQHVYIDYELATVPPGVDGVSYLSDHRPVGSDFFPDRGDNTPNRAWSAVANPQFSHGSSLLPGQVRWYRFDVNGTYEFRVISGADIVYEIYLDTDLSRPRQQYREEVHPDFGRRFVIPSAPFLVKVFCSNRNREVEYEFRAHRHTGASRDEFIDLVPGNSYRESFPAGALLNGDDPSAPWNDVDSKWFRLDTVRLPVNGQMQLEVEVNLNDHADDGAMLFVGIDVGNPQLILVGQDGPSRGPLRVSWKAKPQQRFFVTVQRLNTAGNPLSFDICAICNVTMLLGGSFGFPQLVCADETSGWGSDDIAIKLSADGLLVRHISNNEIGDMDQDDVRELGQWVPPQVAYIDNFEVTVIEEDDTSPDDIGSRAVPVLPGGNLIVGDLAPGVRIEQINPDQTAQVIVSVDVDDGRYEMRCKLGRWHEQA